MRLTSRTRPRGESGSHWTSYSDMMAGLMLVFALIMFFFIFQFLELQETKSAEIAVKEEQLASQQGELETQRAQLITAEEELELAQQSLILAQLNLTTKEEELSLLSIQLTSQQGELESQSSQLITAQEELTLAQQSLLLAQQNLTTKEEELSLLSAQLTEQRTVLEAQQVRIDALVGIRSRIIEALRDALSQANLDVSVDRQTGSITLKGAVLFDVNSADLKPSGKQLLDSFIPIYVRTLMQPENIDYVGEIIIEGHADTDGDFISNLDLSQRRALAVAQYCLQDGFGGLTPSERNLLRNIMTANGRSWSNPIYNDDGSVNKEASRRVEFKFRLKDAEMINDLSNILEGLGD